MPIAKQLYSAEVNKDKLALLKKDLKKQQTAHLFVLSGITFSSYIFPICLW